MQIKEDGAGAEAIPSIQTNHTTYDNLKNKITHTEILANFFRENAHISFSYTHMYAYQKVFEMCVRFKSLLILFKKISTINVWKLLSIQLNRLL